MNRTAAIFLLLFFIVLPIFATAQATVTPPGPSEKHTGFFSATAVLILTKKQWEDVMLDSLVWHEYKPLVKYYLGKKVRSVRWQKSTGRVVVDFVAKDNAVIKKDEAVKSGLFDPGKDRFALKPYIPLKPVEIYIDSPLYIGITNNVTIYAIGIVPSDIIMPQNHVQLQYTGTEFHFTATATIPGKAAFLFIDSATGKVKYICHALVKRLPGDGPAIEPGVRLGDITTSETTETIIKKQNRLIVTEGFALTGGTMYFTGTGFRDVIVVDIDKGITFAKPYIDLCLPGTQVLFDDITVKDTSGKIFSIDNFSIKVTGSAALADSITDYYSLCTFPQFLWGEGSLENFVKEHVAADKTISAEGQRVSFVMKIETDGSVSPVSSQELAALTPLERKCFDIIKNGPAWTAGSFKGTNVPMTVTFFCSF